MLQNMFIYLLRVWLLCIFENLTCIYRKMPEKYLATGRLFSYSLQFNVQGGHNVSPPAEMFTGCYKLLAIQQQNGGNGGPVG